MKMTLNSRTIEILTGLAVILVAGLFLIFALRNSGGASAGAGGYLLSAEFENIEGVNVGTDVRLAGIKVGKVVAQTLNPETYQAKVDMRIDKALQLSEDTTAKITAEGLLGSKFIALEPGGSDVKLGEGGLISYTQSAVDIWSLISEAMFEKSGAKTTQEQVPKPAE
jgi:phospholipid/cholesterol/gamma-HCH transport system substrate-binding protein